MPETAELQIIGAAWGKKIVTGIVLSHVDRGTQSLSVVAENRTFGEGWKGTDKTLVVVYRYGTDSASAVATAKEGGRLNIRRPSTAPEPGRGDAFGAVPPLTIFGAAYGPADVTAILRRKITLDQQVNCVADNDTFGGDSWKGVDKTLVVVAAYAGFAPTVTIVEEGAKLSMRYRPALRILTARWGLKDVTTTVQAKVVLGQLDVSASNKIFGEGWAGVHKTLAVVYQYGNEEPRTAHATEGRTLSLRYQSGEPYEPPLNPRTLHVLGATYGRADVTAETNSAAQQDELDLTADNARFGDTWPGVKKSFTVTYAWGPGPCASLAVKEGERVAIRLRPPILPDDLVTVTGLFASEDRIALQASNNLFWVVDAGSGLVTASAPTREDATEFVLGVERSKDSVDVLTMTTPDGVGLVVDDKGLLAARPGPRPARFVPTLSVSGAIVLGVIGADLPFVAVTDEGSVRAAGAGAQTLAAAFQISLQPTPQGHADLVRALGIDDTAGATPCPELMQLVWDLTIGWFSALGLGPLLTNNPPVPGLWALVNAVPGATAALNNLGAAVLANLGTIEVAIAMVGFWESLWSAGVMWQILRLALETTGWWVVAWALTKVLQWTLLPQGQAAAIVISFGIYLVQLIDHAIAYANSADCSFPTVDIPAELTPADAPDRVQA